MQVASFDRLLYNQRARRHLRAAKGSADYVCMNGSERSATLGGVRMKKIFALMMIVTVLGAFLTGCKSGDDTSAPATTGTTASATTGK
jgi:hypothetical protein